MGHIHIDFGDTGHLAKDPGGHLAAGVPRYYPPLSDGESFQGVPVVRTYSLDPITFTGPWYVYQRNGTRADQYNLTNMTTAHIDLNSVFANIRTNGTMAEVTSNSSNNLRRLVQFSHSLVSYESKTESVAEEGQNVTYRYRRYTQRAYNLNLRDWMCWFTAYRSEAHYLFAKNTRQTTNADVSYTFSPSTDNLGISYVFGVAVRDAIGDYTWPSALAASTTITPAAEGSLTFEVPICRMMGIYVAPVASSINFSSYYGSAQDRFPTVADTIWIVTHGGT